MTEYVTHPLEANKQRSTPNFKKPKDLPDLSIEIRKNTISAQKKKNGTLFILPPLIAHQISNPDAPPVRKLNTSSSTGNGKDLAKGYTEAHSQFEAARQKMAEKVNSTQSALLVAVNVVLAFRKGRELKGIGVRLSQ